MFIVTLSIKIHLFFLFIYHIIIIIDHIKFKNIFDGTVYFIMAHQLPTRFEDAVEGFGETSNNLPDTFWKVKSISFEEWLAVYKVKGNGEEKLFPTLPEAEQWVKKVAYTKASAVGGF